MPNDLRSIEVAQLTGPELKAIRRKAGINQTEMGRRVGIGRQSVSYWERKRRPFRAEERRFGALCRMLNVLQVKVDPSHRPRDDELDKQNAPARGERLLEGLPPYMRKLLSPYASDPVLQKRMRAELDRIAEKECQKAAIRRVTCGAKTRKGHPCRNKSEPGRNRCKFHGGKSTGPRTAEGKARIAEAQRRRWKEHRARKNLTKHHMFRGPA